MPYLGPGDRGEATPYGTNVGVGGLSPAPIGASPSSAGSFLGWFTDTVQQFASTYSGGGLSFGPLTTQAPLPHWVREQLPADVPDQMRNQLAEGAYRFDSIDTARVFMGRFDLTDDESVKQAGTGVSRRTIRGLTGTDDPHTSKNPTRSKQGKVREPSTITVAEAKELPWGWGKERQRKWMDRLSEATGLEFNNFNDAVDLWGLAVERAAKMYNGSKGNNLITPWDALDLYKDEGMFSEGGAAEEAGFTGTRKQRHVDVNKISEGDAWSTMRSAVSSLLGRDPSDQEVRDFAYRMNNLAAKNPSISETVTKYQDGQAVRSKTSVVEPGMTANDVALAAYEDAQDDPDYGAYQAASTYMNLLLQAIGPTV